MAITLSDINKRLIEQNYKLTSQRQLILDIFLKNQNKHLSAEDVHYIIKQQVFIPKWLSYIYGMRNCLY